MWFASVVLLLLLQFAVSVDWDDELQVKEVGFMVALLVRCSFGDDDVTVVAGEQAAELLYSWAPIQVEDAIGLLLPEFPHVVVREFAVSVLSRASDDELQSFLLQVCTLHAVSGITCEGLCSECDWCVHAAGASVALRAFAAEAR